MVVDRLLSFSLLFGCLATDAIAADDSCTTNDGSEVPCSSTTYAADVVLLQTGMVLDPPRGERTTNRASVGASNDAAGRRDDNLPESIRDLQMRSQHASLVSKILRETRGGKIVRAANIEDIGPETSWLPRLRAKLQALNRDLSRLRRRDAQRPENTDDVVPLRPVDLQGGGLSQLLRDELKRSKQASLSAISFSQSGDSDPTDEAYGIADMRMALIIGSVLAVVLVALFCVLKFTPHGMFGGYRQRFLQGICFFVALPLVIVLFASLGLLQPALYAASPWIVMGVLVGFVVFPCLAELYLVIFDYHKLALSIIDVDNNGKVNSEDVKEALRRQRNELLSPVTEVEKKFEEVGHNIEEETKKLAKQTCC